MAQWKPKLLLCEGAEDQALAIAMQDAALIPSDIDFRYIGEGAKSGFGLTGLQKYLSTLVGLSGFSQVKSLGILVDNDRTPPDSMTSTYVQNEIRAANQLPDVGGRFSVPTAPHARATDAKVHATLILMPGGIAAGCFETLLVSVFRDLYADRMVCVDQLLSCATTAQPEPAFSPSKLDKARVRAAIAVLNRTKPQLPLASLWSKAPDIAPVTHALFQPLANHLSAI